MSVIRLSSVTKRYGSVSAVRDVSLDVERGEVFGFLGPNGAGKSTTINMLLDFVRPTAGNIEILGRNPQEDQRAIRERIGVLPEASGYYPHATARDHLNYAVRMKRADDDPDAILERVGIADAADRAVSGFSKGMRQRLGIGIALVDAPDLIIFDEPLGGLDPTGAQVLRQIVREERERGATVFFSSHIMDQVETICDRVGIMHDGELVTVGTVDSLNASLDKSATFAVYVDDVPDGHALEHIDGVSKVAVRDTVIRVSYTNSLAKARVVTHLQEAGVVIEDIATEGASLERLFRKVTATGDSTCSHAP